MATTTTKKNFVTFTLSWTIGNTLFNSETGVLSANVVSQQCNMSTYSQTLVKGSSFFSSLCSRVNFLIGIKAAQQKESGSF